MRVAPVSRSKKWNRDGSTARRIVSPTRIGARGSTRALNSDRLSARIVASSSA
jgi:hypothetical protein